MQIRVACPECGKSFLIPERFAGREGECSKCQAVFHIPEQAERVPESKRKAKPASSKPAQSSGARQADSSSRSSAQQTRPAHDAGVTQEIPIYSIEPSDEFEVSAEIPADPSKPPTFDITDADLLPDEDDSHGDAQPLDLPVAEYVDEDSSQDQPAADPQRDASPTRPRKRRPSATGDEQEGARRARRRPDAETSPDEAADEEAADLSEITAADLLDEDEPEDTAAPMIRRRKSGDEHARSERPSRRSRSSKAKPSVDDDEQTSQRSGGKSNPRQLVIVGGTGAVLLIGAGLYSHFSAPAAPVLPVVLDAPEPPAATPSPSDDGQQDDAQTNEAESETAADAEPEQSEEDSAPDAAKASAD